MSRKRHADTLRTCVLAGAAMGMLFTAVSAYALTAHQPVPPSRRPLFDNYLRQPDALAALRQDLMSRQAQGANASALLAWMQQGGFRCEANFGTPGAYDCHYERRMMFGRVAELQARIVTRGTRLASVMPLLPPAFGTAEPPPAAPLRLATAQHF